MHSVRTVAIGAVALLAAAAVGIEPARAADGAGAATGSATLVRVTLGNGTTATADIAADRGRANLDPDLGAVEATSALDPLAVSSSAVPGLALAPATIEARSTGAEAQRDEASVSIASPVASGTLTGVSLRAIVDDLGARSSLDGDLQTVAAAGGLVSGSGLSLDFQHDAAPDRTLATRSLSAQSVTLLDLAAVLEALGLPLTDLTPLTVGNLLGAVGGSVAVGDAGFTIGGLETLDSGADVTAVVTEVDEAVDAVTALADQVDLLGLCDILNPLLAPLFATANSALADLGLAAVTCASDLDALIATVQGSLAGLLTDVVDAVAGTPLLVATGLSVDLLAEATDDPTTSEATVDASVGGLRVAGTTFDGLGLVSAAGVVEDRTAAVTAAVDGILSQVDAALAGLVDLTLFEQTSGITEDAGRVAAAATFTLLRVEITPPAALTTIVAGIDETAGIGATIAGLGGTAPDVAAAMRTFESAVGGIDALASGTSSVEVLAFTAGADFLPGAGGTSTDVPRGERTTSDPALPATGLDASWSMAAALGLLGLALPGLRRRWPVRRRGGAP